MIYCPEKDYEVPNLDLLTFLLDSPLSWAQDDTVLHAEAADPSNCITTAQTREMVKRLSYVLRHGFEIGNDGSGKDVVICMSSGQILLPIVFLGIIGAGGVFAAVSNSSTAPELIRQIQQSKSRLIVVTEDCRDVGLEAARKCSIPLSRVLILDSAAGRRSLQAIDGAGSNLLNKTRQLDWQRITDPKTLENSLICLLYSSGTTGPPKGVNISHSMIVSEAYIATMQDREYFSERQKTDPTYEFPYRTIGHLPAAHIGGVQGYLVNPTFSGGTVYWMPKFDFLKFCENSKTFESTILFSVPPIYLLIAKSPLVTDHFKTVQQAVCGAAAMGPALQAAAEEKLGCTIGQTWGMSETTGCVTRMPWTQHDPSGGISPLLPNTRVRLVNDDYHDVKEGINGEILVKGPMVTKGYYKDAEATRNAFTSDGWFKTGDIGVRRNGTIYIVDRKKELIKYKGRQVAPAELESHLLSHDLISDAAVIGVRDVDGSGNELPRAYVVADKNRIPEQEVKDFVKRRFAAYKQLRGGVVYVEAIPRSPAGKVLRRELRDAAEKELRHNMAKL